MDDVPTDEADSLEWRPSPAPVESTVTFGETSDVFSKPFEGNQHRPKFRRSYRSQRHAIYSDTSNNSEQQPSFSSRNRDYISNDFCPDSQRFSRSNMYEESNHQRYEKHRMARHFVPRGRIAFVGGRLPDRWSEYRPFNTYFTVPGLRIAGILPAKAFLDQCFDDRVLAPVVQDEALPLYRTLWHSESFQDHVSLDKLVPASRHDLFLNATAVGESVVPEDEDGLDATVNPSEMTVDLINESSDLPFLRPDVEDNWSRCTVTTDSVELKEIDGESVPFAEKTGPSESGFGRSPGGSGAAQKTIEGAKAVANVGAENETQPASSGCDSALDENKPKLVKYIGPEPAQGPDPTDIDSVSAQSSFISAGKDFNARKGDIGAVINLCQTERHYRIRAIVEQGIHYFPFPVPGGGTPLSDNAILAFLDLIMHLSRTVPDKLILVHCTHGINRTGFFCVVLSCLFGDIESVEEAAELFARARGHRMTRQNIIDEAGEFISRFRRNDDNNFVNLCKNNLPAPNSPLYVGPLPEWFTEADIVITVLCLFWNLPETGGAYCQVPPSGQVPVQLESVSLSPVFEDSEETLTPSEPIEPAYFLCQNGTLEVAQRSGIPVGKIARIVSGQNAKLRQLLHDTPAEIVWGRLARPHNVPPDMPYCKINVRRITVLDLIDQV